MRIPFFSDWLSPTLPALEQRSDALDLQQGVATGSGASVANLISGMGTSRDPMSYNRPNLGRAYLSREECFALMRGGLYQRIASIRPAYATRSGWMTDNESVKTAMNALRLQKMVRSADTWGRGTGEARLWIVTSEKDESKPLRRGEQVKRVQVLDRREFYPLTVSNNILDSNYGRAETYQVACRRPGLVPGMKVVHASRLLDFYGHELAPSENGVEGWGDRDAVAQVIWTALSGLDTTTASGVRVASELMLSVFKMSGAESVGTADQAESLLDRLRGINLMKSISNAIYMGTEESFERQQANVSGYKDLSEQARLMLSAVEGTPQTLLFGMAPAGFNTDGESWQEMWYADVAQHQEDRYREPLERFAHAIAGTTDAGLKFHPLGEMDALERAQLRVFVTQADQIANDMGAFTAEEHRARFADGRFIAEFEQGLPALPEVELAPIDPEVEASARSLVETELARGDSAAPVTAWIGFDVDSEALPALPVDAHLTLLFLGAADLLDGSLRHDLHEALACLERLAAPVVYGVTQTTFPRGPFGKPSVYVADPSPDLAALRESALGMLAHRVTAKQHYPFRPHMTIGYLPGDAPTVAPVRMTHAPIVLRRLVAKIGDDVVAEAWLELPSERVDP